ncbi:hypothetical protein [Synechococcus sp. BIOS-E4-1]|uniref:hypothetical protein n=1 Tax=Synechococcus sp. BIOS-E4-1 TaxID=1400864 RepID=UPI0016454899|nr:hypothetical protein [Synechococcus sp. BIOS-E4-1]
MATSAGFRLRVEPLKAGHLGQIASVPDPCSNIENSALQSLLVQSWFSRLEQFLPDPLNARLTRVLALIESSSESADQIESLLLMRSSNRRNSCWHLDVLTLASPRHFSRQQGLRLLIQQALNDDIARCRSWLVRCDPTDRPQLDLLRELGFQPLRQARIWNPPIPVSPSPPEAQRSLQLSDGLSWNPLNQDNARQLLALEQASISPQHRQILDRQWCDLLDLRGGGSTVLTVERDGSSQVIAGLIRRPWGMDSPRLEVLRGPAWDERIGIGLPAALSQLLSQQVSPTLLIAEEDHQLRSILASQGWQEGPLEMMLGRSIWRRVHQRSLGGLRPLESMLGRLQPQQPPLPTPSLAPRR